MADKRRVDGIALRVPAKKDLSFLISKSPSRVPHLSLKTFQQHVELATSSCFGGGKASLSRPKQRRSRC